MTQRRLQVIEHEDLVRLGQVSGVGKKTAQRMLLDSGQARDGERRRHGGDDPALMALVQLGFSRDQATVTEEYTQPTSERVREALKGIQG
jgi:Holliday junction resolvasome RuvABC DNA-binding subunit